MARNQKLPTNGKRSTCAQIQLLLASFDAQALGGEEAVLVQRHLRHCTHCRAARERGRSFQERFPGLKISPPEPVRA